MAPARSAAARALQEVAEGAASKLHAKVKEAAAGAAKARKPAGGEAEWEGDGADDKDKLVVVKKGNKAGAGKAAAAAGKALGASFAAAVASAAKMVGSKKAGAGAAKAVAGGSKKRARRVEATATITSSANPNADLEDPAIKKTVIKKDTFKKRRRNLKISPSDEAAIRAADRRFPRWPRACKRTKMVKGKTMIRWIKQRTKERKARGKKQASEDDSQGKDFYMDIERMLASEGSVGAELGVADEDAAIDEDLKDGPKKLVLDHRSSAVKYEAWLDGHGKVDENGFVAILHNINKLEPTKNDMHHRVSQTTLSWVADNGIDKQYPQQMAVIRPVFDSFLADCWDQDKNADPETSEEDFWILNYDRVLLVVDKADLDLVKGKTGTQLAAHGDTLARMTGRSEFCRVAFGHHHSIITANEIEKIYKTELKVIYEAADPLSEDDIKTTRTACLSQIDKIKNVEEFDFARDIFVQYRGESIEQHVEGKNQECTMRLDYAAVRTVAVLKGQIPGVFGEHGVVGVAVPYDATGKFAPEKYVAGNRIARVLANKNYEDDADTCISGASMVLWMEKMKSTWFRKDAGFIIEIGMMEKLSWNTGRIMLRSRILKLLQFPLAPMDRTTCGMRWPGSRSSRTNRSTSS